MRTTAILSILLIGCAGSNGDNGSDTGTTEGPDFDPYEGLTGSSECEDFDGTPYAGATSFFVGEFTIADGILTGHEDWVLFANSTWEVADPYPGWDCTMRWEAFGTVSEPADCTGCSHEIAIDLTFDEDGSDCQPELQTFEGTDGNVTYYVQAQADGTARWEFTDGTLLGEGVLTDSRGAYVSGQSCEVF